MVGSLCGTTWRHSLLTGKAKRNDSLCDYASKLPDQQPNLSRSQSVSTTGICDSDGGGHLHVHANAAARTNPETNINPHADGDHVANPNKNSFEHPNDHTITLSFVDAITNGFRNTDPRIHRDFCTDRHPYAYNCCHSNYSANCYPYSNPYRDAIAKSNLDPRSHTNKHADILTDILTDIFTNLFTDIITDVFSNSYRDRHRAIDAAWLSTSVCYNS